jgi:ribokinase
MAEEDNRRLRGNNRRQGPIMTQSHRPITAAGVKSTLKSLRTRVGLQPDRLATTELALDALERLDLVRSLQDQGRDRVSAIVEAVAVAAGSLPVTESLIVDAALSLGLNTTSTGRSDRYAADLSDRRYALLQAWDELHIARGDKPPPAPTARALRLDREDSALGLLASVLVGETSQYWPPEMAALKERAISEDKHTVAVIGAAVYDLSCHLRNMPAPNTSAQAYAFEERPGGKGLNQAVGLARLGTQVRLIGPVGSDNEAAEILEYLRSEGVDTDCLEIRHGSKSPRTVVLAFKDGSYLHIGWKNEHEIRLSSEFLQSAVVQQAIEGAAVIMLTLEPARDTLRTIFSMLAASKRCPVILTASPPIEGPALSGSDLRSIDYLIASEWELQYMLEETGDDDDIVSSQDIIDRLLLAGVGTICVLGSNQCRVYGVSNDFVQPAPAPMIITDQSGSKDAFAAALASRLAKNDVATVQDFHYAYYAMLTAGTRFGTSSSLPTDDEIKSLERRINERADSFAGGER